jgi:hypothetical protein
MSTHINSPPERPAARVTTGRALAKVAKQTRQCSATDRALWACDAVGLIVDRLTAEQTARLFDVNVGYVNLLRQMTQDERYDVADGRISLARLYSSHRKKANGKAKANGHGGNGKPPVSNDQLDQLVHDVGLSRMWAAVERATTPAMAAE